MRFFTCTLAFAWMMACGSTSAPTGASPPADSGLADSGSTTPDAGSGKDGSTDCGAVPPSGTRIVASSAPLELQGLTGDGDFVVYVDTSAQLVYAVPVAGGTPVMLGSSKNTRVSTRQKGALLISQGPGLIAPLSAWTEAGGVHPIAASAYNLHSGQDMTADGSYVAYVATTDRKTGTIMVSTADGTKQTALASVDLDSSVNLQFAPLDPRWFAWPLVAAYCLPPSVDAGASGAKGCTSPVVATFTTSTFTPTIIPSFTIFADPIPIDPSGEYVLGRGSGGLTIYSMLGGPPAVVDANGRDALFLANGDVIYFTSTGIVRYSHVFDSNGGTAWPATGNKTTLVSGGGYSILGPISPDLNWIFLSQDRAAGTGIGDLSLASLAAPGPVTKLLAAGGLPRGFTTDSLFALYATNVENLGPRPNDLYAYPVSGGAPAKVERTASDIWSPLAGSKILTNTNYTSTTGAADLEVFDLKSPGQKAIVVTQAGLQSLVTPSKAIVYSWSCNPGPNAGIWVTPSP